MITVCFARALQRCTGRLQMGFRFIFQAVRPIGKTRNQLLKTFPPTRAPGATLCPIACYVPVMCPLCDDFPLGYALSFCELNGHGSDPEWPKVADAMIKALTTMW